MIRRILLAVVFTLFVAGFVLWLNRAALITHIAVSRAEANSIKAGPHQPVSWQTGPIDQTARVSERPPNIIVILFDDLGFNDLSTFGGGVAEGRVPTPNIDRLAAEGAIYTQAYSGAATCAPSRAMLMTGRYPTRTGFEFTPAADGMARIRSAIRNQMTNGVLPQVQNNRAVEGEDTPFIARGLPGSEITIAELLRERGYHTVHIGKWHLGRREDFLPNAQGFNESLLMESGLYLPEDDPDVVNGEIEFDPLDRVFRAAMSYAASYNGSAPFEPGGYLTDWWTDESLKVIEANKTRPFFLYLAHWGPHVPLQATRSDFDAVGNLEPHRLRVYAAMIRALDRSVGRIMDKLDAEGLADNTIIVLTSDNGGAGYVGLSDLNAPFRGWKSTHFEGGIRVPMFIKWPAEIAPDTIIETPVAHIDLMPTLAAAGGAKLPEDRVIDGGNILPIALEQGRVQRLSDAIFWQSGTYTAVRLGNWKLQLDALQNRNWLFDLGNDPTEQNNLADVRPDKVAELQALLEDHHSESVGPLYPHKIESAFMIDKTIAEAPRNGDEFIIWPN